MRGSAIASRQVRSRYRPITIRCGSFDNWARPRGHEGVCYPYDVRRHPFALGVEHHDATKFGLLENSRVDVQ